MESPGRTRSRPLSPETVKENQLQILTRSIKWAIIPMAAFAAFHLVVRYAISQGADPTIPSSEVYAQLGAVLSERMGVAR